MTTNKICKSDAMQSIHEAVLDLHEVGLIDDKTMEEFNKSCLEKHDTKVTKVFYDSEFTGLHQNTTLISIGLVADTGEIFYAEFTDYDKSQVDDWIKENVIKHTLWLNKERYCNIKSGLLMPDKTSSERYLGNTKFITNKLTKWLAQFRQIEFWSDCLAYDWMLFCQLFGHAFSIPKNIYYIPFDLSTVFRIKGIDPDINRLEFSELKNVKNHNALDDALIIKACYEKLVKLYF